MNPWPIAPVLRRKNTGPRRKSALLSRHNRMLVDARGRCDDSEGWFVEPTVIVTTNPKAQLITEEIFGPVLTVLVYSDYFYESVLSLCNESSA